MQVPALLLAVLVLTSCRAVGDPAPLRSGPTGDAPQHGFEARWFDVPGGGEAGPEGPRERVEYRLRRPPETVPGERYPLLVFLHGAGERGAENERQLIHFGSRFGDPGGAPAFDGFVLCPQCPEGRRWMETSWNALPPPPMDAEPSASMLEVMALLEHTLATEPIDPDRVHLTGLSMGGQGAWDLAIRRPERFASLAPVCGGADPRAAAVLADVPVWAWHGIDDGAVPFERSALMVEALRAAGGDVRFERLPEGTGHAAWDDAYAQESPLWGWFTEQSR